MRRLLHVARVLVTPVPSVLAAPWLIMAGSLLINLVTFVSIGGQVPGPHYTGGLASLYIAAFAFAAGAVHQGFPFALGMGVTRRACATAAALVAVAHALGSGIVLYALLRVEDTTGGFGTDMRFFGLPFVTVPGPVAQILVYAVPMLAVTLLGGVLGLVHLRWANLGMSVVLLGTLVAAGLGTVVVTRRHAWPALGRWFADAPTTALWAGWPLLLVAVLLAAGYLSMRRMPVS
jgi:hypothetical protein